MDNDAVPRECEWLIDDLSFAGLSWGPEDGTPVLALHGWMDHAGSFQELAPRLPSCHVIALDLSGQGKSGCRAAHATYNIWDDLPQIAGLLDRVGWKDCILLGHSRGAIIATLFAASQPDRVRALVALDSLLPPPAAPDSFVTTLRAFIEGTRLHSARAKRVLKTEHDYVARRCAKGSSTATAEALADRALERIAQGFRIRGDTRLFASSAVKLTQAHIESVIRAIKCPVLNLWAEDGRMSEQTESRDLIALCKAHLRCYESAEVHGDHHFHLALAPAAEIAKRMEDFLHRHGVLR